MCVFSLSLAHLVLKPVEEEEERQGRVTMENVYETEVHRRPLRIGIAGLGRAGLLDHLPALRQLPGLYTIAAVCDLMKERRDIVERDFPNVRTYRRIEDMLDDPDIDVIDIAKKTASLTCSATVNVASLEGAGTKTKILGKIAETFLPASKKKQLQEMLSAPSDETKIEETSEV